MKALLLLLLAALGAGIPAGEARAECVPTPTVGADEITCTGESGALDALAGDDEVDVETGATLDADASDEVSDAGGSASVELRAVDGGPGGDTITNHGTVEATGNAETDVVDIDPSLVDPSTDVDVQGSADTTVTGIAGGDGDDAITNESTTTVDASAEASGTSVELDLVGSAGDVDASLEARAHGVGLAGGEGSDTLSNTGTLDVGADADASRSAADVTLIGITGSSTGSDAEAIATGMEGGAGDDTLTNTGTLEVRSRASASTTDVGLAVTGGIGTVEDATRPDATATGMAGGDGADALDTQGSVDVEATATAQRTRAAITMAGEVGSSEDAGLHAESEARGLAGGAGDDTLTGSHLVKAHARSEASSVDVTAAVLDFLQETIAMPVEAVAEAFGMSGDAGNDTVDNGGEIDATAEADASFADVEVNVVDGSAAAANADAEARATGIDGGEGDDTLTNSGTLGSTATSDATITQVNLSLVDASIVPDQAGAVADTSIDAASDAAGIRGGDGDDTLHNTSSGTITVTSSTATQATSVSASAEGIPAGVESFVIDEPLVDASTDHAATATGVAADAGDDTVTNDGSITATATSTAGADSVSASIPLLDALDLDVNVFSPGLAVAAAGSAAQAEASGIEGGDGDDTATNSGSLAADATASASAVSVSAALEFAAPPGGGDPPATNLGSIAGTLVEAGTDATADATGVGGGAGADTLTNTASGGITGTARADAQSTGVSVSLAGTSQGIFSAGVALADAHTNGDATMQGMAGGAGDDVLANDGSIEVDADTDVGATNVSVAGQISINQTPAAIGLTWTRADTTGTATSTGMSGGEGADEIGSSGSLVSKADADVSATGVSVDVAAGAAGVAVSGAVSQAATHGTATATGIAGDAGSDTVTVGGPLTAEALARTRSTGVAVSAQGELKGVSAGAAITDSRTTATADATGVSGGDDDDVLTHEETGDLLAKGEADAASSGVSVDVGVTGVGLSAGAALSWANTDADATATGLAGGVGADRVVNRGAVEADADATANGSSVGVALEVAVKGAALGATLTDATTDASATGTGLSGDAGDDVLDNQGAILATADADTTAASVSANVGIAFVPGGAAIADASATSTARATGMDGGAGADETTNSGSIDARAEADATGVPVTVTALGASLGDAEVTADAVATGIAGGDDDDTLVNAEDGVVTTTADSHAVGTNVGVAAAGAALGDTAATSLATAVGMDGGDGNDTLLHEGAVTSTSTASIAGANVNVTVAGATIGNAWSESTATSKGLAGGNGADAITSRGEVTATSTATTPSANVNVTGLGAALGRTDVSANAHAVGIDGEEGDDVIDSTSAVTSTATATTGSGNVSVGLAGDAEVDASIDAKANALGITGGAGNDTTTSSGSVTATSHATAESSSVNVELLGAALGDVATTATANATGLSDGDGNDALVNAGDVVADANATATAGDVAVNLAGAAIAEARVEAQANALAMGAGGGDDVVVNRGRAEALADSTVDASNTTVEIAGFAGSRDTLSARADATALDGGDGNDVVRNEGEAVANASTSAELGGSSVGIFGVASTSGTANTDPRATGLAGGEGADRVENLGLVDVDASVDMDLDSSSFEFGGAGSTSGVIEASAHATGMAGDGGDDHLRNEGDVDVDALSTLGTNASTDVVFGVSRSGGEVVSADPTAIGMDGGDGADVVENLGSVDVLAQSDVDSDQSSFTFGGGSNTDAVVAARATARGLAGGSGGDFLRNAGDLTVEARSLLDADGGTRSTFGNASASASTDAHATAEGIDGGEGEDTVVNVGDIDVTAQAGSDSNNTSNTGFLFGQGTSESDATSSRTASGIAVGDGGGLVQNAGSIAVRTVGRSDADADSDGGDFIDGDASARTDAISDGVASGIRAGDGALSVENLEGASISATASHEAFSNAFADGDGLDGDGGATAISTVDGEARGIWLGDGDHLVINDGAVSATASPRGDAFAEADADEQGRASVTATVNVDAEAEGIRTGDGDSTVLNRGSVTVTANPLALEAEGRSNRDAFQVANVDAGVTVRADADAVARGVHTGSGDDVILNAGEISVTADAEARAVANADGDGVNGDGTASPTADANADALGIDAGAGDDWVENSGTLNVLAQTWALADADADADTGIVGNSSEADAFPTVVSDADATGIRAESGDNRILNRGDITVTADQTTNTADADTFGGGDGSFQIDGTATANATGRARARGIWTGEGNDRIENHGSLTVTATPWARAEAHARGTGLDGDAFATATAVANDGLAVGIDAGDGDNVVINTGTIDVTASPDASASATASPGAPDSAIDAGESSEDPTARARNAAAVGISTGSGADTIVNEGTVIASATGFGSSAVAIRSGAGPDTVVLGDGSITRGGIALQEGDDSLELRGMPTVDGAIDAGSGFDGLVLNGSGAFSDPISGFDTGLKTGEGSYTLASLESLQRLEIDQGTLALESDYAMPAGALYRTRVDGDGSSGLLSSTGSIQVDGDLEVQKGPHAFADGAYDIVRAASVDGAFDGTLLPEPTPLLSFALAQQPDAVQVIADAESFTTVASSRYERDMGRYLDALLEGATGDLSLVLGELQGLPGQPAPAAASGFRLAAAPLLFATAAHSEALTTLGPSGYDEFSLAGVTVARSGASRVQERMQARRIAQRALRGDPGRRVDVSAPAGSASAGWLGCGGGAAGAEAHRGPRPCSIWLTGFGQGGSLDDSEGFSGSDYRLAGVTGGLDYAFGEHFLAGIGVGYASTDVEDGSGRAFEGDVESVWGSLYGTWYTPRAYVEGVVSYGGNLFDNTRTVSVGGIERMARGQYRGDVISGLLGAGYEAQVAGFTLGPFGWLHYAYTSDESFSESGAGDVSLRMRSRYDDHLTSLVGVRISRSFGDGLVVPQLEAGWRHDYDLGDRTLTGAFTGAPGATFSLDGRDVESDTARLAAALHLIDREHLSLTPRIGGELGRDYQELFGMVELSVRF